MSESEYLIYQHSLRRTYYYHRDHQNSIIALTNKEGKIVERYDYDPFGTIILEEHTKGVETLNPYRYTGREYDTDDLYYYRARYYDPTIGRFITPDPIGYLSGDFNFYRYVGNDPVNFVDPSGLIVLEALEGIAGFADSFTFGATGYISEAINTQIYGAETAQATSALIANSTSGQVGGLLADVVNLPKTAAKTVVKTGLKELAEKETKQLVKKEEKKVVEKTAEKQTGQGKVSVKGKKLSECGEVKGYKDSQNENYASDNDKYEKKAPLTQEQKDAGIEKAKISESSIPNGKGSDYQKTAEFDRDHIPAKKYMVERAKVKAENDGIKFNKCMENAIMGEAPTIMVPKEMHKMGGTYGEKIDLKSAEGKAYVNTNANDIMKRDIETYENLMDKQNPTNKDGQPLSTDEKKKMGKMTKNCKGQIKQGLNKMKKFDYENFMDEIITRCTGKK